MLTVLAGVVIGFATQTSVSLPHLLFANEELVAWCEGWRARARIAAVDLLTKELDREREFLRANPGDKPHFGDGLPFRPIEEMCQAAADMGGTAVVGVDLDYESIQMGNGGGMLMVSASGTAVVLG